MTERTASVRLPSSVAVVGLGLIGASLCRALRARMPSISLLGVEQRPDLVERARRDRVCDATSTDGDLLRSVDVVVLCTPMDAMPQWLRAAAALARPEALVTDCGSSKAWVTAQALQALGPGRFLGGHPMAGREQSGYDAADVTLFEGCAWVVTPHRQSDLTGFAPWLTCIERLGAHLEVMPPDEHDLAVAHVSHVPFVVSAALMRAAARAAAWERARVLASTGFRDMVRLAAGSPTVNAAITASNAAAIREALATVQTEIEALRGALDDQRDAHRILAEARVMQRDWIEERAAAGRPVS